PPAGRARRRGRSRQSGADRACGSDGGYGAAKLTGLPAGAHPVHDRLFAKSHSHTGCAPTGRRSAHGAGELEDRQIQRDHHATHHHAEDHHDHGFEQGGEGVDRILHLILVELGDLEQHVVQCTGFLADRSHLHHHVREQVGLAHRQLQLVAHRNVITDLLHGIAIDDAAGGTRYRIQCLHQWDTGVEGDAQGACETGDRGFAHDLAKYRQLQRHAIEKMGELHRTALARHQTHHAADDDEQHQPPPALHELRGADHELGGGGQGSTCVVEGLGEHRHHEQQHDHADQEGHRHHHDGVEQCLLDLLLQGLGTLLVGGDGVQHGVQHTGSFAGLHQVAIQLVELHWVAPQRFVQRLAAFEALLHVQQHVLEADVLLTVGDDVEGLYQWYAGLHHGGDLAAEYRHVARFYRAAGGAEQRFGALAYGLRVHALAAQFGLHQRGVLRRHVALHAL